MDLTGNGGFGVDPLKRLMIKQPPTAVVVDTPKYEEVFAPCPDFENVNTEEKDFRIGLTIKDIEDYFQGFEDQFEKILAFDIETAPLDGYREQEWAALDPYRSDITGISLSWKPNTAIYIPINHRVGPNCASEFYAGEHVLQYLFIYYLSRPDVLKIAHNLIFEALFFYKHGFVIQAPVFDTICAAQLSLAVGCKNRFRKLKESGLKTLSKEILGANQMTFQDATGGKHFDELDIRDYNTLKYACSDADYTLQLYYYFRWYFLDNWRNDLRGHYTVVRDIESPVAVFVGMMKYNGICVNKELMLTKQKEAGERLEKIRSRLFAFAGDIDFGENVTTNVFKDVLFGKLGLPKQKLGEKSGKASVDNTVLILLIEHCEETGKDDVKKFLEDVQEYRKWAKLKSTYVDGFLSQINPVSGKIHTDFFPLGTDTGRMSSSKPNMQNCPRKDIDPIGIRNFIISSDGKTLIDYDLSQIELRVGAHFCQDAKMLETYRTGGDIHAQTTAVIYRVSIADAVNKAIPEYKERRTIAKNVNFGVFFGLFSKGMQRNLKFKAGIIMAQAACQKIIDNIFTGYPGIPSWQKTVVAKAKTTEYSRTLAGRKRFLTNINSQDWGQRSYWERCAMNTPIQGSAADALKLAMGRLLPFMKDNLWLRPLLQIHDELLFEAPTDKVPEGCVVVKASMETEPFPKFSVPVVAEGATGTCFGKLEELT